MTALEDNDSDGELDAEKPLLPARIIPSTYAAEGDLGGGGIPYGWTFETLIGKGTIRERLQRDDSALIKAALRDPHARAAVERREGREALDLVLLCVPTSELGESELEPIKFTTARQSNTVRRTPSCT